MFAHLTVDLSVKNFLIEKDQKRNSVCERQRRGLAYDQNHTTGTQGHMQCLWGLARPNPLSAVSTGNRKLLIDFSQWPLVIWAQKAAYI